MSVLVFTIGHSTRSLDEFAGLLAAAGAESVADVRKLPGSRRHPQFDRQALADSLAERNLGYEWHEALGGRRRKSRTVPPETNGYWENSSFHNYADYALSEEFRQGLERLRRSARSRPVAVMCAESVWWRCHRRIIADHLLAHGDEVRHILGPGQFDPAELTAGAVIGPDHSVTYPAPGAT